MKNEQENSSIYSIHPQRSPDPNDDKINSTRPNFITTNEQPNSSIFSIQSQRSLNPNNNHDKTKSTRPSKKNNVMIKRGQDESTKFNDAGAVSSSDDDGNVHAHVGHASTHNEAMEDNSRERLKRHRVEVAGHVWIPEIWGQEEFLKDWIDCSAFDANMMNNDNNIMSAKAALVEERRRANSTCRLRIENSC